MISDAVSDTDAVSGAAPQVGPANLRLLPWTDAAGRACYLKQGRTPGYVSRMADKVEAEQIDNARECVEYADEVLADEEPDEAELLFLVEPMRDALRDLLRVIRSREDRLPDGEPDEEPDEEEDAGEASG
ncbi:hypothetical protein [Streptomyces sp. NPDC005438]|uniref:hypothetical protein n=1 Tax=Streptomyces sp. NPDC005438 TaxID=3156880 RepID=UPI0033AB6C90